MTAPHETAYPRIKQDPTARELELHYTPSAEELAFVHGVSKQPNIRLAIMLHLKTLPQRGQFGTLSEIPERIIRHVADAMGYRRAFTSEDLDTYDASRMKREHIAQVRSYLNVRPLADSGRRWLRTVAENAALTKHILPDIINVMLEELCHHRYELPAFRTLDEIAASAREAVHEAHFERISGSLSEAARRKIDELLAVAPGQTYSGWQALKREPKRPGNKEVRFYLQHIDRLQKLSEMIPALDVPVPKLKYFRAMARALDAGDLAELKAAKRYALAAVFIRSQHGKTLDDAADLFIRLMQNLENTAQKNLMTYQVEHIKRTDNLVAQLKDILQAYQGDGTDGERINAIGDAIGPDLAQTLAECDEHMAYAGKNFLPFLAKPYANQRVLLLNCIKVMDLHTSSQDPVMDRLIKALEHLRSQRRDIVEVASLGLSLDKDFGGMSANWRKHVFPKNWGVDKVGWIQRRYFEMAVLFLIKDELKSGDLFVPGGERYDDYREELVDEATFQDELASYGEVSGVSTDPSAFVSGLRDQLRTKCKEVNARFPENVHADIIDGRLLLKKLQRTELSKAIVLVDNLITERLPEISIVDVLVDATSWVGLSKHFKPLAGTDARVRDLHHRVVTTLFCYGCNLGPTQTARSVRGFSRRQMAWLNLKYVTDDTLERATVDTINLYNKFELPGYWGTGKSASADGTKWSVYEQNPMSEYHIRYGGYGGIGYYHVSDKYIALFSRFIACGAYEAIYILDGLIENRSDIRPDTVHGDTQAQNFPVFGLAHLLGIDLMPRIRNIKDLSLSKPDAQASYPHIQSLFGEGSIDWDLIETHLHDMLRVAVSIKTGKISASTILRRLGNYSRKNKLYFAFKELGRVIRTLFLLRYIDDVDVRKTIHAATNKSEEFNNFTKWAFFGGQGIIAENVLHEQQKIIGYNHLVANLVILHNVEQMSRVLAKLRDEGIEISPEVLAGLSPYRTAHINRFGDYNVDTSREVTPIDFARRILKEAEDAALVGRGEEAVG
jgi:TnpA family transposase